MGFQFKAIIFGLLIIFFGCVEENEGEPTQSHDNGPVNDVRQSRPRKRAIYRKVSELPYVFLTCTLRGYGNRFIGKVGFTSYVLSGNNHSSYSDEKNVNIWIYHPQIQEFRVFRFDYLYHHDFQVEVDEDGQLQFSAFLEQSTKFAQSLTYSFNLVEGKGSATINTHRLGGGGVMLPPFRRLKLFKLKKCQRVSFI